MKKLVLVLLLVLTQIVVSFAGYEYNENYSNLAVEINGWCDTIPVSVEVFDPDDFANKKEIEDDICGENETPEDDNCEEFIEISGSYSLKAGPLETMEELAGGEFTSSFELPLLEENSYYLEIFPNGEYNDYYSDREGLGEFIEIYECEKEIEYVENPDFEAKTYSFVKEYDEQFSLELENSISNSSPTLQVVETPTYTNATLEFELSSTQSFEADTKNLRINYSFQNESSILKVVHKSPSSSSWVETPFTTQQNQIIVENLALGTYAVYEELPETEVAIEEEVIEQEELNVTSQQQSTPPTNLPPPVNLEESSGGSVMIFLIIIGLGVIGLVLFVALKKPSTSTYHEHRKEQSTNSKPQSVSHETHQTEHLTSYSSVFEHSIAYLRQYQSSYSKDQLYRALQQADVPDDIIHKAFFEVYGE